MQKHVDGILGGLSLRMDYIMGPILEAAWLPDDPILTKWKERAYSVRLLNVAYFGEPPRYIVFKDVKAVISWDPKKERMIVIFLSKKVMDEDAESIWRRLRIIMGKNQETKLFASLNRLFSEKLNTDEECLVPLLTS